MQNNYIDLMVNWILTKLNISEYYSKTSAEFNFNSVHYKHQIKSVINFQKGYILYSLLIWYLFANLIWVLSSVRFVAETEAGSTGELAGNLISPVLDIIVKAHTHAYLSKTVVNNALELLVLTLKELPTSITPLGDK